MLPYVFRHKYLHLITGNPKPDVPRDPRGHPASKFQLSKVGFPIRKSADQRLFAPPHSLSQRTTSFIASYRQGIHQMPLGHLIALISNAHLCLSRHSARRERFGRDHTRLGGHYSERPEFHQDKPGAIAALASSPSPSTRRASQLFALSGDARLLAGASQAYPLFTMSWIAPRGLSPRWKLVLFKHGW